MKEKDKNEWLRTIYIEAWKQYSHEDNISQSRNNLFLAVQAALIAILTGISSVLIDLKAFKTEPDNFWKGIAILGLVSLIFGIFARLLTLVWKKVTEAGRAFLNLRWVTARAIEEKADINGLAVTEDKWYRYSKNNPDAEYYHPFLDSETLKDYKIPTKKRVGGWGSILRVINIVNGLWYFIIAVGALLILISLVKLKIFLI